MAGGAGRSACPARGIVHEFRSHSRDAAAFMLAITAALRDSASRRSAAARLLRLAVALLASAAESWSRPAHAEDGYAPWLRYRPIAAARAAGCRAFASQVIASAAAPTQSAARAELQRGLSALLGATPPLSERIDRDAALVVGPFGLPISTQKR